MKNLRTIGPTLSFLAFLEDHSINAPFSRIKIDICKLYGESNLTRNPLENQERQRK